MKTENNTDYAQVLENLVQREYDVQGQQEELDRELESIRNRMQDTISRDRFYAYYRTFKPLMDRANKVNNLNKLLHGKELVNIEQIRNGMTSDTCVIYGNAGLRDVSIDGGFVRFTTDDYQHGDETSCTASIPLRYLGPDGLTNMAQDAHRVKEQLDQLDTELANTRQKDAEAQERAEFERLRKKFAPNK